MNVWESVHHVDGRLYYWNTTTNETTWIKPKEIDETLKEEIKEKSRHNSEYDENLVMTTEFDYSFLDECMENDVPIANENVFKNVNENENVLNLVPPEKVIDPPLCPKMYKRDSVKDCKELITPPIVRVKIHFRKCETHPVKMILTIGSNGKIMDHLWNMVNSQNVFIDEIKNELKECRLEIFLEKYGTYLMQQSFRCWQEFKKDQNRLDSRKYNDTTQIVLNLLKDQLSRCNIVRIENCIWNFILLQIRQVFRLWSEYTFFQNTSKNSNSKCMDESVNNDIHFSGLVFSEYVKTKQYFEKRLKDYRKLTNILQERFSNLQNKYKIIKHEKNEYLRLLIEVKTSRARENWDFIIGNKNLNQRNFTHHSILKTNHV